MKQTGKLLIILSVPKWKVSVKCQAYARAAVFRTVTGAVENRIR